MKPYMGDFIITSANKRNKAIKMSIKHFGISFNFDLGHVLKLTLIPLHNAVNKIKNLDLILILPKE